MQAPAAAAAAAAPGTNGTGGSNGEAFRRVKDEEWLHQLDQGTDTNHYEDTFGQDGYGFKVRFCHGVHSIFASKIGDASTFVKSFEVQGHVRCL
jgi:LPS sulfotransferase NodH